MKCREARNRLTGSRRAESSGTDDRDLKDHLEHCRRCAQYAASANLLVEALNEAGKVKAGDVVPVSVLKARIEAGAAASARTAGRLPRSLFLGWLRPGTAIAAGALVVGVVLILALVPFQYHKTIGYDIAFAGVNKELAEDDERICDLLHELGLVEAAVDVLECELTCSLMIIDLKSEQEVALVVTALSNLNDSDLTTNVIPLRATASGSLLDQANERL
ncbi:MAG: hypothetical protein JSU65_13355 [Candidatus Zixiibacteriota bacterium]|nr:MAG: hypothetical protein JSU65_13355 [candidate division Zixibacteria bacterium]